MNRTNIVKIMKILLLIIALSLIVGIIFYLAPVIKEMSTKEGQLVFKEKIDSLGIYGILLLLGLQLAQIFLIIIPGEPLEVLAGMCYGPVGGTIFISITVLITTTIIFYLVRKLGNKFVYEFFSKEKIKKIENSKIFKNKKTVELIMIILFLLPGTPKDLLVYIGGLLPIKPLKFILISTFVRLPSVISSTIAGNSIVSGNFIGTIITYVVTLAISIMILLLSNKLDKHKMTKQALETIK